jgi:signal transduction histidine kinase
VDEIKTLAWELRPTVLDDLGLYTALSNYVEKWTERSGVPVDFHCSRPDERRLPPQVETAVYRIVQEATTNVLKHAQASRVSLILELRSDHVFVVVEDNGKGFDVEAALKESVSKRRMGLLGMRERVALVGGRLNIESSEGMGATMFVRIPVTACEKGECIK